MVHDCMAQSQDHSTIIIVLVYLINTASLMRSKVKARCAILAVPSMCCPVPLPDLASELGVRSRSLGLLVAWQAVAR